MKSTKAKQFVQKPARQVLLPKVSPLNKHLPANREILRRENLKLGEIVTLRKELTLNYSAAYSFHKIIKFADLPYNFNQVNKVWWRWHSEAYGFFYHRVKRDYSIWLTTFLKGNIGVYMPFVFGMPNGKQKPLSNWRRRAFLYQKTLKKKERPGLSPGSLSFQAIEYTELSEAAKDLLLPGNRSHRPINSPGRFGLELDMFVSGYNAKWHSLYKPESLFFDCGRMPTDFITVVNSFFVNTGFFINSYDSELMLFPQYYLDYKNKRHSQDFKALSSFFLVKYNEPFYHNILTALKGVFVELSSEGLQSYIRLYLEKSSRLSELKLNLYVWYLYFIKFYYGEVQGTNHWLALNLYLTRFKACMFSLIDSLRKGSGPARLQRALYFAPTQSSDKAWLGGKDVENAPDWPGFYFAKVAHKFSLANLKLGKPYLKKAYVSKWVYFWENLRPKFRQWRVKSARTPQFVGWLNKMILDRVTRIRKFKDVLLYLESLKGKKPEGAKAPIGLLSPSVVVKQGDPLLMKLKWVTSFGKVFVKLPPGLKSSKKQAIYFSSDRRAFRFLTLLHQGKRALSRVRLFLSGFGNIIVSGLKMNFGFSYGLLSEAKSLAYFSYGLQGHLRLYFDLFGWASRLTARRPLLERVPGFRRWNSFDKNFFACLHPFSRGLRKKRRLINFPVLSNWNGIKLKRFKRAKTF